MQMVAQKVTTIITKLNRLVKNIAKRMGFTMHNFPNDDDGNVLQALHEKGIDLTKPREIEFYCYVSDLEQANEVAAKTKALGFIPDIYEDETTSKISVYNTKRMVPTYQDIMEKQKILNSTLKAYGTVCDGWGTLNEGTE